MDTVITLQRLMAWLSMQSSLTLLQRENWRVEAPRYTSVLSILLMLIWVGRD